MTGLILLLQADNDIQTAFNRYEEFQEGRGKVFLHHLEAALRLVRQHPELAPVYAGRYRRMLVRDFPYGIFYEVHPTRVVVTAILDLRQNPQTIRRKVTGE